MRCFRGMSQAIRWIVVVAVLGALPHRAVAQQVYWYAHWNCGSSSQCASVMGKSVGDAGPFDTLNACNTWRQTYIIGASCDNLPTGGGGGRATPVGLTVLSGVVGAVAGSFAPNKQVWTLGGAGAASLFVLMFEAKEMPKPVAALIGGAAGAMGGAAFGYYNQGLTTPAPQATVARVAEIGGGGGVLLGLGLSALKGSEFRRAPSIFRALGHLQVAPTARRLGLDLEW